MYGGVFPTGYKKLVLALQFCRRPSPAELHPAHPIWFELIIRTTSLSISLFESTGTLVKLRAVRVVYLFVLHSFSLLKNIVSVQSRKHPAPLSIIGKSAQRQFEFEAIATQSACAWDARDTPTPPARHARARSKNISLFDGGAIDGTGERRDRAGGEGQAFAPTLPIRRRGERFQRVG